MKQFLLTLGIAAATLFGCLAAAPTTSPWSYTTSSGTTPFKNGSATLNEVEWTCSTSATNPYFGADWSSKNDTWRGLQFGKGNAGICPFTLTTPDFKNYTVTQIKLNASAGEASKISLSVKVGNSDFKSDNATSVTLGTSKTDYTFSGNGSGDVVISYTGTTTKAVYLRSIEITFQSLATAEKVTLTSDGLVVTDENDQTLNADGSYEYAAPTKISFAYTGDTGVANPDITYSYSVDGAPAVEGNEYTYEADKDVTLTVNAISSNTVSKTINLNKQWPTECPLPVFSVENNAEVQQGQTISVSCEGAKDLIWTVNDTDIEGTSYTVTEAPGTTLTFHALASVDGKTGELNAENSITVKVVEATSATFDFANNTYGLTPQTDSNTFESNMDNPVTQINSGIATIKFEGEKYRYWNNDKTLRVQTGSSFTISVPDKYYITGVTMTGTCSCNVDSGTYTNKNWTPGEKNVTSIKFSPTATTKIDTIVVNYAVDTASGISDAMVDGNDAAEYFNLQGLRVAQPEAGQIYIRVQNGKASKLRF